MRVSIALKIIAVAGPLLLPVEAVADILRNPSWGPSRPSGRPQIEFAFPGPAWLQCWGDGQAIGGRDTWWCYSATPYGGGTHQGYLHYGDGKFELFAPNMRRRCEYTLEKVPVIFTGEPKKPGPGFKEIWAGTHFCEDRKIVGFEVQF